MARHQGPPLWNAENAARFREKYAARSAGPFAGPFIEDGRYAVEVPRRFRTAEALLGSEEVLGVSLGKHVRSALKRRELLEGPGCWSEEFAPFLGAFLEQRGVGIEDGAELLLDGRRIGASEAPPGFVGDAAQGLYVSPRIFDRVGPTMRIAQEECFGPTVNLIEVGSLDEAIAAATATRYALSAAIYTRDARAMLRFKEEVDAGMISINGPTIGAESHLPFGGNGWSGNGTRESGIWVLDAYTRWQAVNVDHSGRLQRAQIDVEAPPFGAAPDLTRLGD